MPNEVEDDSPSSESEAEEIDALLAGCGPPDDSLRVIITTNGALGRRHFETGFFHSDRNQGGKGRCNALIPIRINSVAKKSPQY